MNEKKSECCAPTCCPSEKKSEVEKDAIRDAIRQDYARVANAETSGESTPDAGSCCGVSDDGQINTLISTRLGYDATDLEAVPDGANMGLGCGNPRAIASLKDGEVVVDLGSGGGFDCFLAAAEVGESGYVIGVDMTPTMVSKARANAERGQYKNVHFRLGEIEHLPVADNSTDVIISNCVINLSPDKDQVFREAYRVLKPGGRLAISDVVATIDMPEEMRNDPKLLSGCMAGAVKIEELQSYLEEAGFTQIAIHPKDESKEFIKDWAPGRGVEDYVVSATIEAVK